MSQQGQGGKQLLFALAVPTEQQQLHKCTFLCKTPCLKVLRTQEKVSLICRESQQQETVTATLVPVYNELPVPPQPCTAHLLDSPWKKLPSHSHLLNSCYFQSFLGCCVRLDCLPHTVLWAFKREFLAVSPWNTRSCPASCCRALSNVQRIHVQQHHHCSAAPRSRNLARITLISLSRHNPREQQKFCLLSR